MKPFLFAVLLGTLSFGLVGVSQADPWSYHACAHNNSKNCRDARAAFAEHHNGMEPDQWYNHWYEGNQGRWNRANDDWRWEGINGDEYRRDHDHWQWFRHHDDDHDRD
jgi:hypothetical protein